LGINEDFIFHLAKIQGFAIKKHKSISAK
jgi:hypothetical protein